MRRPQAVTFLVLCIFVGTTLYLLSASRPAPPIDVTPPELTKALPPSTDASHPIRQLIAKAEEEFNEVINRQSDTLEKAVAEYRRRYQLPPPPNFDKWYEFAKARNVALIDEYDTIYNSLLPFWALQPSVIRGRAREALGFDNALVGVIIRDGKVISAAGGSEWQQKSTVGMVKDFVQYLPDMDLPFNIHDEPRVVVPHDDLSRLVATAKDIAMPAAFQNTAPRNSWSPRAADMDDGTRPNEVKFTRFNVFAHQPTWTNSRMSCSPESPARTLDESIQDDSSAFAFSPLGFIYNKTAFSDICLSPSLKERHGFFNRPNAFNIVSTTSSPSFPRAKSAAFRIFCILPPGTGPTKSPTTKATTIPGMRRKKNYIGVALQQVDSPEMEAGGVNTGSCLSKRSTRWITPWS